MTFSPEIDAFYRQGFEHSRLAGGDGLLEKLRTLEVIHRHLPQPPATILDVGGASGVYALTLAAEGHRVHLFDPVSLHIEQARAASARQADYPLASAELADARNVPFADNQADAVLLLGPLYHLTEAEDRRTALCEAHRCLRPGGIVFAAAISRFASLIDGLSRALIDDPAFVPLVQQDLRDGRHRNPTGDPKYFTTAYLHQPHDLLRETESAGFRRVQLLAVEGPAWFSPHIAKLMENTDQRNLVLQLIRSIETESALLGASAHILAIGWK